jgi:hypothetical protein
MSAGRRWLRRSSGRRDGWQSAPAGLPGHSPWTSDRIRHVTTVLGLCAGTLVHSEILWLRRTPADVLLLVSRAPTASDDAVAAPTQNSAVGKVYAGFAEVQGSSPEAPAGGLPKSPYLLEGDVGQDEKIGPVGGRASRRLAGRRRRCSRVGEVDAHGVVVEQPRTRSTGPRGRTGRASSPPVRPAVASGSHAN